MKKLLSILGAVGMIASVGVTVVACGNKDNAQKETEDDFKLEGEKTVEIGKEITLTFEVKENMTGFKVIADEKLVQVSEITLNEKDGSFTLLGLVEGEVEVSMTAEVKKETQEDPVFKSNKLKVTVTEGETPPVDEKTSINDLGFEMKVGQSYRDVVMKVQNVIDEIVKGTKIDVDYLLTGIQHGEVTKVGTIEVLATDESELITGSFKIEIKGSEKPDPEKVYFDANFTKNLIAVDELTTLTVTNFEKLENVKITLNDELSTGKVEILDHDDKGHYVIKGIGEGRLHFKITAENGLTEVSKVLEVKGSSH